MKPSAISVPGSVITRQTAPGYLRRTAAFLLSPPRFSVESCAVLSDLESRIISAGFMTWDEVEQVEREAMPANNQTAARIIAQCQATIEALTEYRQALAARYAALATAAYTDRLEIERYPGYGGIKYYVRIVRTYEDGTTEDLLSETYPGKERRTALTRFEELHKQHPGIEAVKDIARRSWER